MAHVVEHLPGIEKHLMASPAFDVRYETDPAAVFFVAWVVEASLFWKAFKCHGLGRPSDKKWSSLDGACP